MQKERTRSISTTPPFMSWHLFLPLSLSQLVLFCPFSFYAHTIFSSQPSFHSPSLSQPKAFVFIRKSPPRGRAPTSARTNILNIMAHNMNKFSLSLILILILQQVITSKCKSEAEILLQFKDSLENNSALTDWDSEKPPCDGEKENWAGVLCEKGFVWGLKLENMGLSGSIDVDSLSELKSLRTISLMHNNFDSSFPNIKKLGALKTMYLSYNKFSGEISSDAFHGMNSIKKIHMAHNKFSGLIPSSLTTLSKLMELMLEDNDFDGEIPRFSQERLISSVNFSNNHLEGQIPASLSKLNESSFWGNLDLCGAPLKACSASPKLSVATIVVVAIASLVAVVAIIAVIIILRRRKKTPAEEEDTSVPTQNPKKVTASPDLDKMEKGVSPNRSPDGSKKTDQSIKLSFLRDDVDKFDMSDLLKASAEILGSGVFGSSYKAALGTGQTMVVKRYRQMNNVNKDEFHEHMRRLGGLSHHNLLPLVAFYYRKEEKLMVSRYIDNVSLAVHLHGNKSRGQPSLDWPTRLKIVKGVSEGLLYLYNSLPSLVAPHGHLKSSNVLLNGSSEPLLTDYGLLPVVNIEHAQEQMIAYKSPEFRLHGRIRKKTDVWSLGILILEILTGKFPSSFLQQGKGSDTDLSTWVQSVVNDESTVDVFEADMRGTKNNEGEMMKLLKIALNCCETEVDKRLEIAEAVERIQEIKVRDGDDDFYSSYTSEGDMHSSRGFSNDFDKTMYG